MAKPECGPSKKFHFGDTAPTLKLVIDYPNDRKLSPDCPLSLIKDLQKATDNPGYSLNCGIQWNALNYDVTYQSIDPDKLESDKVLPHITINNGWTSPHAEREGSRKIQACVKYFVSQIFKVDTSDVMTTLTEIEK